MQISCKFIFFTNIIKQLTFTNIIKQKDSNKNLFKQFSITMNTLL